MGLVYVISCHLIIIYNYSGSHVITQGADCVTVRAVCGKQGKGAAFVDRSPRQESCECQPHLCQIHVYKLFFIPCLQQYPYQSSPTVSIHINLLLFFILLQWEADLTKMEEFQRYQTKTQGQDSLEQHHLARMAHAM